MFTLYASYDAETGAHWEHPDLAGDDREAVMHARTHELVVGYLAAVLSCQPEELVIDYLPLGSLLPDDPDNQDELIIASPWSTDFRNRDNWQTADDVVW